MNEIVALGEDFPVTMFVFQFSQVRLKLDFASRVEGLGVKQFIGVNDIILMN